MPNQLIKDKQSKSPAGFLGVGCAGASAVATIYGPEGVEAVNDICGALGEVQDIIVVYKKAANMLTRFNAKAAKTFATKVGDKWGTLAKKAGKDFEVCAWNGGTGTCGSRTAIQLDLWVKESGFSPDVEPLARWTVQVLVYTAFGNEGRRAQYEDWLNKAWVQYQASTGASGKGNPPRAGQSSGYTGRALDVVQFRSSAWENVQGSRDLAKNASVEPFTAQQLSDLATQVATSGTFRINVLAGAVLVRNGQVGKLAELVAQKSAVAEGGGALVVNQPFQASADLVPDIGADLRSKGYGSPAGASRLGDSGVEPTKEAKSVGTAIILAVLGKATGVL